jgi:hypothetical protein
LRKLTCCACRAVKKQAIKAKQPVVFFLICSWFYKFIAFCFDWFKEIKDRWGCGFVAHYLALVPAIRCKHFAALHFASLRGFPHTNSKENDSLRLIVQPGGRFYPAAFERLIFM